MWYRCAWTQPRTGRPFSSSIYLVPPPKEHPWHRMAVYTKYKASTAQQAASTTVLVFYNESIKEMLLGELWKVVNSAQEESLERNPFELQALVHKLVFTGAHARLWAARETLRGMVSYRPGNRLQDSALRAGTKIIVHNQESEGTNRGKILGGKNLYKVHQFGRELVGLEDALSELTQNIRSLKAQHELIFDLRMHGAANNIDVQLARRASSALECLEGNFTSLSCGYKGFMKRLELLNNLVRQAVFQTYLYIYFVSDHSYVNFQ